VHPGIFAAREPGRPAVIMGTAGTVVDLRRAGNPVQSGARLARQSGLRPVDGLAAIVENRPEMFAWPGGPALRAAVHRGELAPDADEAGYVVTDSRAGMVVVSSRLGRLAARLGEVLAPGVRRLMIGGTIPGWESYEEAVRSLPLRTGPG